MSAALKFSTSALNCPSLKGIPIYIVDTHCLIYGGANELLLGGYSDRDIKKWGDGAGKILSSTYVRSYIVSQRAY